MLEEDCSTEGNWSNWQTTAVWVHLDWKEKEFPIKN